MFERIRKWFAGKEKDQAETKKVPRENGSARDTTKRHFVKLQELYEESCIDDSGEDVAVDRNGPESGVFTTNAG